ncbi:MAG TPA: M50 family metallopeptidase [Solirubrobacteraceae bacterium]|nr:M50 family metallopeptidase [Solirubrobacteraceae bacterium]
MSWLLAFLGFAALIILHEAGHFAAAKAVGMRVERFALFFPPLWARHKRGETEYAIGSIPLGGYVKITGMNPAEEIPPEVAHRAYFRQPVWKRVVVISAGPAVNILIAFLLLAGIFWVNGTEEPPSRVASVTAGSPAAQALRPGDELVSVDGKRPAGDTLREQNSSIADQIATHKCTENGPGCRATEPVTLQVRRDGQLRTVRATPVYDEARERPLLGFTFGGTEYPAGPGRASELSVKTMWEVTSATVTTLAGIFQAEKRKEISGVVGSYETTRQSIEVSTTQALFLLAIISLSLGVINLFPFLPLDGGHIFWALAEKVRGRAIPFSVMERAGFVGFALVMVLFAIGFTNDLGRLMGEGFNLPR